MSETIMLPTNYELVVKDKATAMQYAISQARVFNNETRCYDLDLELAKNIFKLFCDNVNLPDVEGDSRVDCEAPIKFNVSHNTLSQETADELDVALQDFKKSVDSLSKMSVVEETIKNAIDKFSFREHIDLKHIMDSLKGVNDFVNHKPYSEIPPIGFKEDGTTVVAKTPEQTYEDVAKDLFNKPYHYINSCGEIGQLNNGFSFHYAEPNNFTSRKQAEKLLALNKLMNVAKYLNGDWQPKFYDGNEKKWYIYIDEDGDFDTSFSKELVTTSVYFKSQELAEKAIEILGNYTISLALSTDW